MVEYIIYGDMLACSEQFLLSVYFNLTKLKMIITLKTHQTTKIELKTFITSSFFVLLHATRFDLILGPNEQELIMGTYISG